MNLEINNLLINSVPEGIIAFDTSLQIITWNTRMEQFFHLSSKEVIGHKVTDSFMPGLFQENFHAFFMKPFRETVLQLAP